MKRTPLKRRTRLRPEKPSPRRSSRERDADYMERVRQMACCMQWMRAPGMDVICVGINHAHHMREATSSGMAQKPDDSFCVAFCLLHHSHWHSHAGIFKNLSREWRREFAVAAVAETRSRLGWRDKESK